MTAPVSPERLNAAYRVALDALLEERHPGGYWGGELSTSPLSTATAVSALALVQKQTTSFGNFDPLVAGGLEWLTRHQNADGGWGDTVKSLSNISTTMLCRAAFRLAGAADDHAICLHKAEQWLQGRYGKTPEEHAEAVRRRYGKDRTFSVPILMTSALAGLVAWREVPPLPFELACLPQAWFRFLQLPVVSYALPALIAIGQAVYHHRPPRNLLVRGVRKSAIPRSLRVLEAIQPSNGGFLEATPLTSFVAIGLAGTGRASHAVVRRCVAFLVRSLRPDGSWPIDTNLSTWVTTLAVNALATAGEVKKLDRSALADWLLGQQFRERHPFTGAAPGGWGWTPLPGSVPDSDDTPGALLALDHLLSPLAPLEGGVGGEGRSLQPLTPDPSPLSTGERGGRKDDASPVGEQERQALAGLRWLLNLQNRDGGWPTFCRGWGHLPFDRSGPDLTAHVLRALAAWSKRWPGGSPRLARSMRRGLAYLARTQRKDGSWLPLWFGNQHTDGEENPTYGTARVLAAYRDLDRMSSDPARRGLAWLRSAPNADGGWGGAPGAPSSLEETALAVEVLLDEGARAGDAVNNGLAWLVQRIEAGGLREPTPIGFYFAKLWYFERLYPILFSVAALGRARRRQPERPLKTP